MVSQRAEPGVEELPSDTAMLGVSSPEEPNELTEPPAAAAAVPELKENGHVEVQADAAQRAAENRDTERQKVRLLCIAAETLENDILLLHKS